MKASFDLAQAGPPVSQSSITVRKLLLAFLTVTGALYYLHGGCGLHRERSEPAEPSCPQVESHIPSRHDTLLEDLNALYDTPKFKDTMANWMSGAVQIPTESYDEMEPVGRDRRWDVFSKLHDYLQETFPKVHDTLTLTKINTYGLLFHWNGSDKSLKPLLLLGHQDVVPVEPETVGQWKYPPYSGYYDGDYIHGRGSVDDKSTVISILTTLESLIERGFAPRRTIVLSFGFDEESSGKQGALQLAGYLEQIYGRDAFAMLVDEGSSYIFQDGFALAIPGTSEKGHADFHFEVNTPGGHSSIPPKHTGIGLLANLIVALEEHAPVPSLRRESAIYEFLQCIAAHDLPLMPPAVRKDLLDSRRHDGALHRAERALLTDPGTRSMLGTTQAADLVRGGVKVNALPETAKAVVNYRIDAESSVKEVQKHVIGVITPLAKKFNLSLNAFGEDVRVTGGDSGIIVSDAWGSAFEPAPVTPTGKGDAPYKLLSGTIRAAFERGHIGHELKKAVVAPAVMGGNTDTRRYWNLTKHIFRYSHVDAFSETGGEHTINEAIRAVGLVDYARFFVYLILNVDETTEF